MSDLPAMPPPVQQPAPAGQAPQPPGRPGWATAIGLISTILASLFLVFMLIGLATRSVTSKLDLGTETFNIEDCFPDWYATYQTVIILLGIAFAALLLVCGIAALRKRAATRALHLVWAGIYIVVSVVQNVIEITYIDLSSASPTMRAVLVLGIIIMIPLSLAYPVFLLIWFNRAKIKQQISTW